MLNIIWLLAIVSLLLYNRKIIYYAYFFVSLIIPFNDNIYEIIGLKISNITIMDLVLVILFIDSTRTVLKRQTMKITKIDIGIFLLICLFALYTCIGYTNNNLYLYSDILTIGRLIIVYYIYRIYLYYNYEEKIMYLSLIIYVANIYSVITIILYFFKEQITPIIYAGNVFTWWGTSRISFSNSSIFILIPFILYILKNKMSKFVRVNCSILCFLSLLISQSRTAIICYIVSLFIIIIAPSIKRRNIKWLGVSLIAISVVIFLFFIFNNQIKNWALNSNNTLILRFAEFYSSNISTGDARVVTNEMNRELLKESRYLGIGIGKEINLYTVNYQIASIGAFIDNGFLTLAIKMGSLSVIIVLILIVIIINRIFFIKKIDKIIKMVSVPIIGLFILNTAIINAQLIYSLPVSITSILGVLIILNDRGIYK